MDLGGMIRANPTGFQSGTDCISDMALVNFSEKVPASKIHVTHVMSLKFATYPE